jgi:anti-anti-sigma factor
VETQLLESESELRAGLPVVTVRGELIEHTGPRLRQTLCEAAARSPHVLIDMRRLESMDSSGLAVLLRASKDMHPARLHFFGFTPRMLRLLELTGLDEIFDIHATEDDARVQVGHPTDHREPLPAR